MPYMPTLLPGVLASDSSQIVWAYIMTLTPAGVRHLISPRWLEEM